MLADRFGERADVMRTCAAADAEIADVDFERLAAELGDLEPVAGERIERDGKRPRSRRTAPLRVAQRLERRLAVVRPIRYRQICV